MSKPKPMPVNRILKAIQVLYWAVDKKAVGPYIANAWRVETLKDAAAILKELTEV